VTHAPWLLLAALSAAGGCERTGVLLTVRATGTVADQLRLTATVDGGAIVRVRPESPSPLQFPLDLFAEFDARPSHVVFTVEALQQSQTMAAASSATLQLQPNRVISATVDLTPSSTATLGDAGAPDLAGRYAATVLADAPLAYYRLDETSGTVAHDASGHQLDGVYGAAVGRGAAGLLVGDTDGAASFNGGAWSLERVVTVPRNPALEPYRAVSIELWMQQRVYNRDFTALVEYGDFPGATVDVPYAAVLYSNAFGVYLYSLQQGSAAEPGFHSVTQPALGATYHVVITYDGANVRLYVDGVLEATKPFYGAIAGYGYSGLGIGGSAAGGSSDVVFAGTVDEVAIYGAALPAQRVMAHYAAGLGKPSP
jgi:hypothetical protein